MATRVTFHPGLGRFLRLLVAAVATALLASLVIRLAGRESPQSSSIETAAGSIADTFIPAIALCVSEGANDAMWVESLLARIGGQKQVVVPNGRIDLLTEEFAIEVDFIQKWHEGIGQALHYASATGKRPALALVVPHSEWPLKPERLALLRDIDGLSAKQQIRLVVLRPGCSE